MNKVFPFFLSITLFGLIAIFLWSCDWDLPSKKTQRNCTKPTGALTAQIQQRNVNFSITGSAGTIDKVIWDFGYSGAGSTTATTGLSASFSYPVAGTYTAKATLTNTCDQETILTLQVIVADATVPTVSLQAATNITLSTASIGMTVTSNGNATITQYGICYSSTNQAPTTVDDIQKIDGSIGLNTPILFNLINLQPNTTYYVRSFATNQKGTGYSSPVQSFRTGSNPSISLAGTPTLGITTATVGMIIYNFGEPAAIEYGICYSSSNSDPKADNSVTKAIANPSVGQNLNVELANLTANTRYYYRAYAKLPDGSYVYTLVQAFQTLIDTLEQDLIASVSFTNGSLLDISGNNNHVNLVNNPTFTTDRNGNANAAILLNGLGDYFYMAENTSLRPTVFSISLWIKPISLDRDKDGWMQIYNKSRFSDGGAAMYSALIRPTIGAPGITINTDIKQESGCISDKGWETLTVGTGIELSKWYHIVFTYNGAKIARMYINGQLLYTKTNFPNDAIDQCSGGELKFGAQSRDDTNYFYGGIDDIRIYRRVLTDSEVQSLYNQ